MINVIISGCFHVEILMSYQVIAQISVLVKNLGIPIVELLNY
jgi:hypothetical protein